MFFADLFWVYGDYKTENLTAKLQNTINILPFPRLA